MIRPCSKQLLLVAPEIFPVRRLAYYKNIKHISVVVEIFPSIFNFKPDIIIFDYDLMGGNLVNVLRRIRVNKFYRHIKIWCYRNKPNEKIDSFLGVLGVDHFIYKEEIEKTERNTVMNVLVHLLVPQL
jgi:DNA-binding NarL/FixJ family response regulator